MSETPNAPTAAERRYPEIPDGRMCESCGSLRYHATFCEKAPPMIRAGIRHHFDLLDIQLRQLGVVDDPDLRPYRDELGKAVGLVSQLYDAALLAARREVEEAEKRARYAEAALQEIDRPITSIDGARQIARNYFAGWEAVMGNTPNQEKP